jgi:hypothetical protein
MLSGTYIHLAKSETQKSEHSEVFWSIDSRLSGSRVVVFGLDQSFLAMTDKVFQTSKFYIRIKFEFFYKWNGIDHKATAILTFSRPLTTPLPHCVRIQI